MSRIFIALLCTTLFLQARATDTLKTLHVAELLQMVRQHHPVAQQAVNAIRQSEAELTMARGAFDPLFSHYLADKTFGGTEYYRYSGPQLSLPTWFGVELHAGLEQVSGSRLFDPSETPGRTSYAGISVPLAKNLVIDKRRAFLQQARIFTSMAATEQRAVINDLLMDAIEQYWSWVSAYQIYVQIKNNVAVNERRLAFVKSGYANGERPAIDTVEALVQLQSFQYQLNDSWLQFQNAGLQLSAYLWLPGNRPYQLPETIVPHKGWEQDVPAATFNLDVENLVSLSAQHPDLLNYRYKLQTLVIDRKLKFQELLPKIDFRYNQLGKGYNLWKTAGTNALFGDNFQYGVKIELPLRLSYGRGAYRQAKLKIQETELDQHQKQRQIEVKIRGYYNEMVTLRNQVALQRSYYENQRKLVVAEETRLANGESSLFLINARENKAIEAYQKLVELQIKYYKTLYALQWSAGLLR